MSTKLKSKSPLPTPPPRTRSATKKSKLTPIITNVNQRNRSRSANPKPRKPDRASPVVRSKSRSRGNAKTAKTLPPNRKQLWEQRIVKNETNPNSKPRSKSKSHKRLPNTPNKKPKRKPFKPKSKTPVPNNKNTETNSNSQNFPYKRLPNTPTRIRAKTTAPKSSKSANTTPNHKLPTIGFNGHGIDNSPSLKPSLSTNYKKPKPLPNTNATDDQKQNFVSSKPPPPPRNSGHHRDYSIVKSVPLSFKMNPSRNNKTKFGLKPPPRHKKGFATANDKRKGIIRASCQCKAISYELLAIPQELQHCYCSMCRKQHGSASATWTPFLEQDIRFLQNETQTAYKSSQNVTRTFCSVCGSNVSLKYKFQTDTIWITPSLFDGPTDKYSDSDEAKTWWLNVRVLHIFCESKCEWYEIPNDGHPQLSQTDIQKSEINGEPRFMYNKQLPPKPTHN